MNETLKAAILGNDVERVKALLNREADPNIPDENDNTALHLAAENGYTEIVEALIRAEADLDLTNENYYTALHIGVEKDHTEIVHALIRAGADVNLQNENDNTALHVAAENGYTEIVEALIRAEANLDLPNENYDTALHIAAENGGTEIVQALITAGTDVNFENGERDTALYIALEKGHTEIFNILKDNVGVLDYQGLSGYTALHIAAENGDTEIVQALITAGADVNLQNENNNTALHIAAENGDTEIVQALITAGADVNLQNEDNNTALDLAAVEASTETVRLLLFVAKLSNATIPNIIGRDFNTDSIIAKILECHPNIFTNLQNNLNSIVQGMQNDSWKKEAHRITLDFLCNNFQAVDNLADFLAEVTRKTTTEELGRFNKNDPKSLPTLLLCLSIRQNLPLESSKEIAEFAGAFSEKKQKELLADHLKGIDKLIARLDTLHYDDNLPQGIRKQYNGEYTYSVDLGNGSAEKVDTSLNELSFDQLRDLLAQVERVLAAPESTSHTNRVISQRNAEREGPSR